jgi:bifunctional non-homologous end joining protein LigD
VNFIEPKLVCEVGFTERTSAKVVRHPTFRGLRPDEDPVDVVCKGLRLESEEPA